MLLKNYFDKLHGYQFLYIAFWNCLHLTSEFKGAQLQN